MSWANRNNNTDNDSSEDDEEIYRSYTVKAITITRVTFLYLYTGPWIDRFVLLCVRVCVCVCV